MGQRKVVQPLALLAVEKGASVVTGQRKVA